LIASPAAVAVWSGWVGLGTLCGFGVVHPLPGIADSFTIDTAVTLPVGVEAYGAYALRAWLTPGASKMARKFARWSAIGRLALGMLGQVIYHLLAAAHATRAPWPVVVLVSCLLVVTLGFGAALTHLLRAADGVLARVSIPVIDEAAGTVAPTVPDVAPTTPDAPEVERTVARRARRRPVRRPRTEPQSSHGGPAPRPGPGSAGPGAPRQPRGEQWGREPWQTSSASKHP
jgi:hypothetical protein